MGENGHIYLCPTCDCPIRPIKILTNKVKGHCPLCDKYIVTNKRTKYFRYNLKFPELLRLIELCKENCTPMKALEVVIKERDRKLSQTTVERIILVALKTIGLMKDKDRWGFVAVKLSQMDEYKRITTLLNILWNIFCYDKIAKLDKKEGDKRGLHLLIDQGLELLSRIIDDFRFKSYGPLDLALLKNEVNTLKISIKRLEESVKEIIKLLDTKGSIGPSVVKELKEKWGKIRKFYDMLSKYEEELTEALSGVNILRETVKRVKSSPRRSKKSKK